MVVYIFHFQLLCCYLQYFGHVFLAVNGDNSETEEFMFRKLAVLHRIIGFAFGPAVKQFVHFASSLLSFQVFESYCLLFYAFTF